MLHTRAQKKHASQVIILGRLPLFRFRGFFGLFVEQHADKSAQLQVASLCQFLEASLLLRRDAHVRQYGVSSQIQQPLLGFPAHGVAM